MDINYLKGLSKEERIDLLQADAISIEETKYTKPLTQEEVSFYKDKLTENSIQQATILDELADVKADFKARLKPVQDAISEALQAAKFKAITCEGRVYKLADHDENMIYIVDEHANLISSRQMMPEERQLRIQPIKQKQA